MFNKSNFNNMINYEKGMPFYSGDFNIFEKIWFKLSDFIEDVHYRLHKNKIQSHKPSCDWSKQVLNDQIRRSFYR